MPEAIKRFQLLFDDVEVTDPVNWPSFTPEESRDEVYHTIFVQFTEQRVILVKDAKNAADTAFDNDGVAASIAVKWKEWNSSTQSYDTAYNLGKLSFKPGHYKRFREKTEVVFEPIGFIGTLRARDEIETSLQRLVDIDGDAITAFGDETQTIVFDNYILKQKGRYNDKTFIEINESSDNVAWYLPIFPTQKKDGQLEITLLDTVEKRSYRTTAPDNYIILTETGDLDIRLDCHFGYSIDENAGITGTLTIEYQLNSDTPVVLETVTFSGSTTFEADTISYNDTISLAGVSAGDTLKIYFKANLNSFDDLVVSNFDPNQSGDGSEFPVMVFSQDTEYYPTNLKGMLIWEYFLRICQKITGRTNCFRSSLFGRTDGEVKTYTSDGALSMIFISNVYQLRGYPISTYPIKASLKDAFMEMDKMFMLGLSIIYESGVPYIQIERLEDYFDPTTIAMTLNAEDPGIRWEPAMNYLWGTVKSGYRNFQEKDTGSLGATHTPRQYSISGLDENLGKEYNIESEIITSIHLIEALRRKRYDGSATKDEDFNAKNIALLVKRDGSGGFERVKDENFDTITNLDNSSSASNIELTPARVTINHAPLLLSGLVRSIESASQNTFLRFQSGEVNTDVTTKKTGEPATIAEGDDIDIDMLPGGKDEPLFDASFLGTFTAKLTKTQRDLFRDGVTGLIKVIDGADEYLGYYDGKRDFDLENQKAEIKILRKSDQGNIEYLGSGEDIEYLGSDGGQSIEWLE